MADVELPDPAIWQPTTSASETLKAAFEARCAGVESLVRVRAKIERDANINQFDSGPGVEDIIREQLQQLSPTRYTVTAGVVSDRRGSTAGDCDIVIFNADWFPAVKSGATAQSRRVHFPIEGVYAVIEIKQTLSISTLDDAFRKLVPCHRLYRPPTSPHRHTENRDGQPCLSGLTNPLYSAILATDLAAGCKLDEVVERFIRINQRLKRLEVIRSLCVMGHGTITWGYHDPRVGFRPALFMNEDLALPLSPAFHRLPPNRSALYPFVADLHLHLFHSILAPEDIPSHYGPEVFSAQGSTPDGWLEPEPYWVERLRICEEPDRT